MLTVVEIRVSAIEGDAALPASKVVQFPASAGLEGRGPVAPNATRIPRFLASGSIGVVGQLSRRRRRSRTTHEGIVLRQSEEWPRISSKKGVRVCSTHAEA
jgi:hypothetical protein